MFHLTEQMLVNAGCLVAALVIVQMLTCVYTLRALRGVKQEREALHREVYGLLRKIEGVTSHRREQILKHYDGILEDLTRRLPPQVATHASQAIFDMESKILARLAELDNSISKDHSSRQKIDDIIESMERLEQTIVTLTSDTVRQVMLENRRNLSDDELGPKTLVA